MINLITGTPGSGKTYLALKDLTDKHFYWHKKDHCFYRKTESKKYEIFTNISDFKLPHKNLNEIFRDQKLTFDSFFTTDFQTKLHQKYPHIIYIIDECQQFIPFAYKNTQTILYFDTHRHFGDKIYLITQDIKKITISIQSLVEIEYRAVKSTFTIFGGFRYNIKSSGDIFETKSCRKDKRIFDLYKSFVGDDQEKKTNFMKYYIVAGIIAFLALGYYFYAVRLKPKPMPTPESEKLESTKFKNEIKRDYLSEVNQVSPEINLNEIRSFKITQFVTTEQNELIFYQDPITGKWFNQSENPYKIVKSNKSFYIFLSFKTLTTIKKETDLINSTITSTDTPPPPPPHQKTM